MSQIGQFTREETGFSGHLRTLTLDLALALVPVTADDVENAPAYRVHAGDAEGPEVGAAWRRSGEKAGAYLSVQLDDPALPQPIRANLFRDDPGGAHWSLYWNRPKPRDDRD